MALYQTDYWGLIGPQLIGNNDVAFQNITRARIRGVDVATRATVIPSVVATEINYTYLDPQDVVNHQWLPYRSRHNVTGSLDFLGRPVRCRPALPEPY